MPTLSCKLSEYTARKLQERGIKVLLNRRVKSVTASRVLLTDGSAIETHTIISTVGNAPHPLVAALCEENGLASDRGRIVTTPTCQVPGHPQVWAAGDCAAVPYVRGGYCPATAQFALRQGELTGDNIARCIAGRPLRPLRFKELGEMATIGHHRAVAEILRFRFSGWLAWWIWRTVYLLKLPRLDRKVRVMLDWTLDLFFPRDINVLNPRFSTPLKQIYLERGDVLFRPNEPAFSFYVVQTGRVEVRDDQGVVQTIAAGEFFGERALLEDGRWHFEARAAEPSTIVSIPATIFHQVVRAGGSLSRMFQKSAARYAPREMIDALTRKLSPAAGELTARELMAAQLQVFQPELSVRDALQIAREHPHTCYPVVDRAGHPLGVVNREDFYEFLKRPDTTPATPIQQMGWARLPVVRPGDSLSELMERLVREGVNKLLVVDSQQRLLGIITMMDLFSTAQAGVEPQHPAPAPATA